MKPTPRQQIPAPTIVRSDETPKADPRVKLTDGGIELTSPTITLRYYVFVAPGDATNTNRLTPKRAVIAGNVVFIEELGLIFPLAGVEVIRTGETAPKIAAA